MVAYRIVRQIGIAIYRTLPFPMILSDSNLVFKSTIYSTSNNSKMVQDRAIVKLQCMADQ